MSTELVDEQVADEIIAEADAPEAVEDDGAQLVRDVHELLNRDDDDSVEEEDAGEEVEGDRITEPKVDPEANGKPADGPSAAMRQLAKMSGVSDRLMSLAKTDDDLQVLIEDAEEARAAKPDEGDDEAEAAPTADAEKYDVEFMLPEEEFGPDDPVAKQIRHLVEKINANQKMRDPLLGQLLRESNERKQREQQDVLAKVQAPFDEALDQFESEELGSVAKGLNKAQIALRSQLFKKYEALGASPATEAAKLKRFAELALAAERDDIVEKRNERLKNKQRQPKSRLGGTGRKPVPEEESVFDAIQAIMDAD